MKPTTLLKIAAGFVALALGAVGVVIPVWPTTPFVLLAIGCFGSMPGLQARVLRIGFFRQYYQSYTQKTALPLSTVVVSLTLLWGMLALSMLAVQSALVTVILLLVGSLVTVHILVVSRLKFFSTKGGEPPYEQKQAVHPRQD